MKVLHVIPSVAARYGGPSAAVLGYCRALRANGIDVQIASTNADGPGEIDVPIGLVCDYHGAPAIFFPRRGERFKWSGRLAAWLRDRIADWDLVHIHAVFSHSSLAAARACRRVGVPYVVRPLGSLNPWALQQKALQKRMLMRVSVRPMLEGAAAIHYTSRDEERRAEEAIGRLPSFVLPLGVDGAFLDREPMPPDRREKYVLALTRLHPVKNLEALIDAFLALPADWAEGWRLVIAGAGDPAYAAALQARAAGGGAAGRVQFAGWVDGDAKMELLSRASMFALPSHTENFGAGLVEALARGVPAIVSSAVNLSSEVQQAGAGWVAVGDVPSLTTVLRQAIEDEADRHRRARAAREFAGQYAWPAISEALIRRYAAIAARHRTPMEAVG